MPEITLDISDELLRRIRVVAARAEEPARAVAGSALERGVGLVEMRFNSRITPRTDRASLFRLWLIETKGLQESSARTLSSVVRRSVKSGLPQEALLATCPPSARSSIRAALRHWNDYCAALDLNPESLDL